MPTINQLPLATSVGATDLVPISQGGTTKSVTVQGLLSSTQGAISSVPGSLLGRISPTAGGPEPVSVGLGLALTGGALVATAADHVQLPISTNLSPGDEVVVNSGGFAKRLAATLLRGLFTAGTGITIDPAGTISAPGVAGGGSGAVATQSMAGTVKPGAGFAVAADGTLSVADASTFAVTAAGATAPRGLATHFAETADVLDQIGVDRTGAADSAPGFVAAVNRAAAANASVVVPPGDYRLNSSVQAAPNQTFEMTAVKFSGPGAIVDTIDASPFQNRISKAWLRNSVEPSNAFTTITTMNIGVTGSTVSYEKGAAYDFVLTADPSTYTGSGTSFADLVNKDAVGRVIVAEIAGGNMTGRAVGLNIQAQVSTAADGVSSGLEVDNVNNGTGQPLLDQPTTKLGGAFVAIGAARSTAATLVAQQGTAQYFTGHLVRQEAVSDWAFRVLPAGQLTGTSFGVTPTGDVVAASLSTGVINGPVMVQAGVTTATSVVAASLMATNGFGIGFAPRLGAGNYNGLVQADDAGLLFGIGDLSTAHGLFIGPNMAATSGIRIGNDGTVALAGAVTVNGAALAGGAALGVATVRSGASYSMQPGDRVVLVNKTAGSSTSVVLPGSPLAGADYSIKDGRGDAGTNPITISAPGGVTIDGVAMLVIGTGRGAETLRFTGTEWSIF